jgi:hypothetical protein
LKAATVLRLLAVLALIFAPRVEACSCVLHKGTRDEQVLEALNDYGVVFVARLRSSTHTPDKIYAVMTYEDAQFVVIEVLKGPLFLGQPIRVQGYIGSGSCAVSSTNDPMWIEEVLKAAENGEGGVSQPAKFSKEWLIYADGPGPYELNMCSRTIALNMGGDKDLKILREFIKRPPKRP